MGFIGVPVLIPFIIIWEGPVIVIWSIFVSHMIELNVNVKTTQHFIMRYFKERLLWNFIHKSKISLLNNSVLVGLIVSFNNVLDHNLWLSRTDTKHMCSSNSRISPWHNLTSRLKHSSVGPPGCTNIFILVFNVKRYICIITQEVLNFNLVFLRNIIDPVPGKQIGNNGQF